MDQDFNKIDTPETEAPKANGIQKAAEWFSKQPTGMKVVIVLGAILFLMVITRSSGKQEVTRVQNDKVVESAAASKQQIETEQETVEGDVEIVTQRTEQLQAKFIEQQQRALSDLRGEIEADVDRQKSEISKLLEAVNSQNASTQQMINTFNAQMKKWDEENQRTRREMGVLADEARRRDKQIPIAKQYIEGEKPAPKRTGGRIGQVTLSSGPMNNLNVDPNKALLRPIVKGANDVADGRPLNIEGTIFEVDPPQPFLPPLGFVKGTLLNGFDAIAIGGKATPALVRISGKYRTAMNSTIYLDGCFMLVEFEGEISTERAVGKPSRMTCVYPDRGAVTYSLTGYVVDAKDGIVGLPGVFYEGDPSRIMSAMVADFAAGVADVIENNQSTFTTDSSGNAQKVLTGEELTAEIAGGVGKAVGSLRDYLLERATRVAPFIRVDSTRELHIVLLSGAELRSSGSAWSLLFDGEKFDEKVKRASQKQQQQQNQN